MARIVIDRRKGNIRTLHEVCTVSLVVDNINECLKVGNHLLEGVVVAVNRPSQGVSKQCITETL